MIDENLDRLEVQVGVRMFEDVIEEAKENVRVHHQTYENLSHYIRAAVVALNIRHKEGVTGSLSSALEQWQRRRLDSDAPRGMESAFVEGWQAAKGGAE